MFDKIKVYIDPVFKGKKHNLLQSIVFFCSDVFKNFSNFYDELIVSVSNEEENIQGCFLVIGKTIFCNVYLEEIAKACKVGISFKSFCKALFLIILHEVGHAVVFLEDYSRNVDLGLEEYFDQTNKIIGDKLESLKLTGLSKMETSRQIREEIEADRFAFKNLSYFENLYEFEGILV